MHYSLGLTLSKRANDFDTYMGAWKGGFKDPDVIAVAKRVSVVEIPEPKNGESAAVAVLTVKTQGGRTYVEELLPSKGSPQNPMTYEELEAKFMGLATRVLPEEQASKIAATR